MLPLSRSSIITLYGKLKQNLMKSMASTCLSNRRLNSLTAQLGAIGADVNDGDDDNDNYSLLLLSQDKITDFLRGVQL